jgi:release factor glutamine methyltransferase
MRIPGNRIDEIKRYFDQELKDEYDASERLALFRLAAEDINGYSMIHIHLHPDERVNESDLIRYSKWVKRLKNHEPVQYIRGKTWFMDLEIEVNPAVLIPRPETEELVNHVLSLNPQKDIKIIDACSGSGCISLALKHYLPIAQVDGFDVSQDAIDVARSNAKRLNLDVSYQQYDIMQNPPAEYSNKYDFLVSNPPYIPYREKVDLALHVSKSEPSIALFVDDDDALIFYKRLAKWGSSILKADGIIMAECHKNFPQDVSSLWQSMGIRDCVIHEDLSGHPRFVVGKTGK